MIGCWSNQHDHRGGHHTQTRQMHALQNDGQLREALGKHRRELKSEKCLRTGQDDT
jgi:hypothetical protein